VSFAKHLVGVRYSWGGSSPRSGFDCSGFVRYVYGHFGISLSHSSFADYWRGRHVGRWAMRPGDLVFFDGAGHVGIYIGHGRFIHAPHTGTVVRIETMAGWYSSRFDGARRIVATA
jgi:cell wall-associated NlpC family hydrolase